jgi:hypothetical protein
MEDLTREQEREYADELAKAVKGRPGWYNLHVISVRYRLAEGDKEYTAQIFLHNTNVQQGERDLWWLSEEGRAGNRKFEQAWWAVQATEEAAKAALR